MATRSYWEKLKDPRWQKKRLQILERDSWRCTECGNHELTLHVHHGYYAKGVEPWEYPDETLSTLCEECHRDAESARAELYEQIALLRQDQITPLCFIAKAIREWPVGDLEKSVGKLWELFDHLSDATGDHWLWKKINEVVFVKPDPAKAEANKSEPQEFNPKEWKSCDESWGGE